MATLRISLAQMEAATGNVRKNLEAMQAMVEEAARRGSQVIVLPELWDSGYAVNDAKEFASALNAGVFAQTSTIAKQNNICVIGSSLEKRGVGVANTAAFFAPNGRNVGVYRKIHIFKLTGEDRYLQPGSSVLNLELPWGKTGIAICYDLRFPEMFRRYGVEGSRLVLMPAAWPAARIEHWRALIRARAIENQYFVAACNFVGQTAAANGSIEWGGHSMIVDPWGETVLEAGTMPGLYSAEINLDRVDEVRKLLPVFEDRKPEAYGLDDVMSQLGF